jgi:putative tricarboxylic transport membrane protein
MMIADGNILGFFGRPVAAVFGVATLLIWSVAVYQTLAGARNTRLEAA